MSLWDRTGVATAADAHWDTPVEVQFRQEVAGWIGPAPRRGASLLDVGCGTARTATFLKGFRYIGIDSSQEMLRMAKERLPSVAVNLYDITKGLPYANSSFDIVLCSSVLRHMPSYEVVLDILREIARVARDRALIVDNFRNGTDHIYSETNFAGQLFPDNCWGIDRFLEDMGNLFPGWQVTTKQIMEWLAGVEARR